MWLITERCRLLRNGSWILSFCSRITGGFSSCCCCCCDEATRDHRSSFLYFEWNAASWLLYSHFGWVIKGHQVEKRHFCSLQRWRWIHWIIQLSAPVCARLCARVRACWRSCVIMSLYKHQMWDFVLCVAYCVGCVCASGCSCLCRRFWIWSLCVIFLFLMVCFHVALYCWIEITFKNPSVCMLYLQWFLKLFGKS